MLILLATLSLAADPAVLVSDGWGRIRSGDYEGARILAEKALEQNGGHHEEATYLLAFALEWGGDAEQAVHTYDRQLSEWPDGVFAQDARFRRIEALGRAGAVRTAVRALRREFRPFRKLAEDDQLKVSLLIGTWKVEAGQDRRGTRILEAALAEADARVPYYQAKARASLVEMLVQRSDAYGLTDRRTFDARLALRAGLLEGARAQVEPTAALEQHRFALQELFDLGRGYEALGDDLLHAPADALASNRSGITAGNRSERVESMWMRALKWYQLGVEHVTRVQWQDAEADDLVAARDRVQAKLDAAP